MDRRRDTRPAGRWIAGRLLAAVVLVVPRAAAEQAGYSQDDLEKLFLQLR